MKSIILLKKSDSVIVELLSQVSTISNLVKGDAK